MGKEVRKSIEVLASDEGFETALAFVEEVLSRTSVNRQIAYETTLVFETVFSAMLRQGLDPNTMVTISQENNLNGISLKIVYEGKRFTSPEEKADVELENRLLENYADKVSHNYRSGYNTIRISVSKKQRTFLIACGVGILVALAAYAIISMLVNPVEQSDLLENYIFPFEQVFANAILMVGAPATFFSLMKNSSDAVVTSERILNARRLHIKSFATSVFATLLALLLSIMLTQSLWDLRGHGSLITGRNADWSLADIVVSAVPPSIFEPLETISPIPLIIVALLLTYALVSSGKDFDILKRAIDVCYGVFSRMLSAIMVLIPAAYSLAVLDILIKGGYKALLYMAAFLFFIVICTLVLLGTYAIRLKVRGIKVVPFAKKLIPLLRENRAIGSAIDAAPFNVRYCVKHYGMDRSRISRVLPLLSQINRDANCFFLIVITILFIFSSGVDASILNIVVICVMSVFLSFGAPNQPGTMLIGTLMITNYLNSFEMICVAICLEVFLGGLQNLINVIGDIVMTAEEEGVHYAE